MNQHPSLRRAHAPGFMLAPASQAMSCSLLTYTRAIFFISTAESAAAGIAALVPVGLAPEPSHKRFEPQLSCPACGTFPHGLNAPGNYLPIRPVPTPRRCAPDRPLDHRAWQLPRHDLAVQLARGEF